MIFFSKGKVNLFILDFIFMLESRGIRRGVEVFVRDPVDPDGVERRARVINTYPHPSSWLVVQFDDGNTIQVEGRYVTTMFERNRRKLFP